MSNNNKYYPQKLFELSTKSKLMIYSISYEGKVAVLSTQDRLELYNRHKSGFLYLKGHSESDITYELFVYDNGLKKRCHIRSKAIFREIAYFSENEVLLYAPIPNYSDCKYDRNCYIYNTDTGKIVSNFTIGEKVCSIKVDSEQNIWVTYSEDIYYDNTPGKELIGKNGMSIFDKSGKLIYQGNERRFRVRVNVCPDYVWLGYFDELGDNLDILKGSMFTSLIPLEKGKVNAIWKNYVLSSVRNCYGHLVELNLYRLTEKKRLCLIETFTLDESFSDSTASIDYNGQYILFKREDGFYLIQLERLLKAKGLSDSIVELDELLNSWEYFNTFGSQDSKPLFERDAYRFTYKEAELLKLPEDEGLACLLEAFEKNSNDKDFNCAYEIGRTAIKHYENRLDIDFWLNFADCAEAVGKNDEKDEAIKRVEKLCSE